MEFIEVWFNGKTLHRLLCLVGFILFVYTFTMMVKEFKVNFELTSHLLHRRRGNVFNKSTTSTVNVKFERIITKNSTGSCFSNKFDSILLVFGFGAMTELESIPLFELLYKKTFKNRVYCGPEPPSNSTSDDYTFSTVNTRYGAFLYDCLTSLVKTHQNYSGYLFLGEDILLNYWNLLSLDLNLIWESDSLKPGPDLYNEVKDLNEWWPSPWGMQAVEKVYEYFSELNYYDNRKMKLTEGQWTPTWDVTQALNKWLWNGKGLFRTYWSDQSFVYLPRAYVNLYTNITKHVRSSGVRHGIALPLIIRMMALQSSIVRLKTSTIDKNTRNDVLNEREHLKMLSINNELIHLNGTRKDRRGILNRLIMKEYAVGKFLEYRRCRT